MLDVHPPHEAAHTWKDFLIHIATIVIGLLIAVGLEQTVEAIHHAHQRRELREALHSDTELNDTWVKKNIDLLEQRRHWAIEQLAEVERVGPTGRLRLHRMPNSQIWIPNTGVWLSARQNGEASLLTAGEQNWFTDLDRVENEHFVATAGSLARLDDASNELDRLLIHRYTVLPSGDLDLSALTAAERLRLDDCLRSIIETSALFELGNITYGSYNEYLLTTSFDKLEESKSMERAIGIYERNMSQHPDLKPAL